MAVALEILIHSKGIKLPNVHNFNILLNIEILWGGTGSS